MADEKKPGLLKRIFSFGFGKKAKEEPADTAVEDAARAEAEAAKQEAARLEAERVEAEEKARLEAEQKAARESAEQEAEAARKQAEATAAQERAVQEAAAKERAAKEEAEAKAAAEKKAKAEKAKTEAEAARKAEAERIAAEKALAKQKAQEEAERLAAERAAKLAAEEAERLAAEEAKAEAERRAEQERKEREASEKAADEEEKRKEAERVAAELKVVETEEVSDENEDRREGWFKRLRKGLARSSSNLTENITSIFTKRKLDEDTLQDLEDILIQADLGVETAMNITDALSSQRLGKDITDIEVRQIMAEEITKVLKPVAQPLELDLEHQPHVILVVGVNGSGKTTTIGKLSQKLRDGGFSTLLVAGDTFRAAAIEQLHIWGERTGSPVLSRDHGADAAGLAFDAWDEAKQQKKDVIMMDTAGRLQNRKELMDELEKIVRVLKKQDPTAPHTVLLTLDATTGQNALNQVEIFKDVAGVNGLVMTKLDGTARGGILVAISAKYKLSVYFVGVGEQVEDLEPFEAEDFARSIAGLEDE